MILETDQTGRKRKTFVRAAGATLAWQTVYYNTVTQVETEYVNFEHLDASGLSYRSTLNTGTAIMGEGGEGSPAELDPFGSNVGLFTPYIELTASPFEPEYPSLQQLYEDMPMYVNGQLVTATLDGVSVPLGMALGMMANGSAIPAALAPYQSNPNFNFSSNGLGLYSVTVPLQVGWHVNPNGSVAPVYSQHSTRSFSFAIPWESSWRTQQQNKDRKLTKYEIKGLRDQLTDALDIEKSPNCRKFLNETLRELGVLGKGKLYNDIMDVFDLYASKAAIYDAPGLGDGEAPFPANHKNAKLRLDLEQHKQWIQKGIKESDYTVLTIFHELIHGSGRRQSFRHNAMGIAMHRAAVKLGIMPERDLPVADQKKLNSKDEFVSMAEEGRLNNEFFNIAEETLKAACRGSQDGEN